MLTHTFSFGRSVTVHKSAKEAAFFPIPKILMHTGRRSDFPDYELIVSADIGFVDLSVRIRAKLISGPLD